MSVTGNFEVLKLTNRIKLRITHFAYGTYPTSDGIASLPQNRFFMPAVNGGAECFIADSENHFSLLAGNVYFIPAYHGAQFRLDEHLKFLSIQFSLELWEGLDIFAHVKSIQMISKPSFLRRGLSVFHSEDTLFPALQLRNLTMDFCQTVIHNIPPEELDMGIRFSNYQKEIEYLNRNINANTTVEMLADLRGERRETFTRKFTADTGMTPKHFITRVLFNRACERLIQTNLSIKSIAAEFRFSSEYYFSNFFKKQSGTAPGNFRKQYR